MVGNLSYDTDERSLSAALESFGRIVDVKVVTDRDTGRSRGFGFVTFGTADQARSAIEALDGVEVDGRPLRVNEAQERRDRGGPRRGGHGGGGGGNRPRW